MLTEQYSKFIFKGKYNFWPWKIVYILKILFDDPKTFFLKLKKKNL